MRSAGPRPCFESEARSLPRERLHSRPTVTLVIPCLNESRSLPAVLGEAREPIASDTRFTWRFLVADNGSTDGSVDIALH